MGAGASVESRLSSAFKPGFSRSSSEAPIYFIDFDLFKEHGCLPRLSVSTQLVTPIEKVDRDNSLIVFISYCWLRNVIEAEGWMGRPYPDDANNMTYDLCVEGIARIKELAPGMEKCYVWLDYGCIDQDDLEVKGIHVLARAMEYCDCVFTPIIRKEKEKESIYEKNVGNDSYAYFLEDYKPWSGNPHAVYLRRGWCRMEMLLGSCIPLLKCGPKVETVKNRRRYKFATSLYTHATGGKRPHYVCDRTIKEETTTDNEGVTTTSTTELLRLAALPHFRNSMYSLYRPERGQFTHDADKKTVEKMIKSIKPLLECSEVGYNGQSKDGLPHGFGTYQWATSDLYIGSWWEGTKHGHGAYYLSNGDFYDGDYAYDVNEGQGVMCYHNGDVYEGSFSNNLKHGLGTYKYSNGAVYKGAYREGVRDGVGKYKYQNGDTYKGMYVQDKRTGEGQYYYVETGNRYRGDWVNDKKQGTGTYTYSNGDEYEGQYYMDKKYGKGVYKYVNGDVYDGDWVDNQMVGSTTYTYVNGDIYVGEYFHNRMHGKGNLKYASGNEYEGDYIDGLMHGKGRYRLARGDVYDGDFAFNKKDGHGMYKYHDDETRQIELSAPSATAQANVLLPLGMIMTHFSNVYEGGFKNDLKEGFGTLRRGNGDIYKGQFKEGEKHGEGSILYFNGDSFEGAFEFGKKNGYGVATFTDDRLQGYEGNWKDDEYHGEGKLYLVNDDTFEGTFVEGEHRNGKYTYKSTGDVYAGEFNCTGEKHGKARMVYSNGDVFDGFFENNKKNGTGTYVFGNPLSIFPVDAVPPPAPGVEDPLALSPTCLVTYDGEWKEDKFHGHGTLRQARRGDNVQLGEFCGVFEKGRAGKGMYKHFKDGEIVVVSEAEYSDKTKNKKTSFRTQ